MATKKNITITLTIFLVLSICTAAFLYPFKHVQSITVGSSSAVASSSSSAKTTTTSSTPISSSSGNTPATQTAILTTTPTPFQSPQPTMWQYQCIDTMKTSRDRARNWQLSNDLHHDIAKQISLIKGLGANCVAIDTPYDLEFLPYLTDWVNQAREAHLHIWFRGNFSSWEGWFNYPKGMTAEQLFTKTRSFILANPQLFADGDIFTPAPEAENGGPFNQVEPNQYPVYRQFLITEYQTTTKDFNDIHKHVITNWLSMNGGLARRMLDQQTINQLGNVVAIDHYIATPEEMSDYISYFAKNFHARVVIGEFGAPIPDINGSMTDTQQAQFVNSIYQQMYKNKNVIAGVNYWALYDSSTALYNEDGTPRDVTSVIQKYYQPVAITGQVTNPLGIGIRNVTVSTPDIRTTTNNNGAYKLIVPDENTQLTASGKDYLSRKQPITVDQSHLISQNLQLTPNYHLLLQQLRQEFRSFFSQ